MPYDEREIGAFHLNRLRLSTCTRVQVDRAARALRQNWHRLRLARRRLRREQRQLRRDQQDWLDGAPRRADPARPFCYVLSRMRRAWREADREADLTGVPADLTIGSTRARARWSELLRRAMIEDQVVRIRHKSQDGPALLMSEARFRALEGRAAIELAPPLTDPAGSA